MVFSNNEGAASGCNGSASYSNSNASASARRNVTSNNRGLPLLDGHCVPPEIFREIFSSPILSLKDRENCVRAFPLLQCSKLQYGDLLDEAVIKERTFGKEQWEKYFGEIGKEPPLPKGIYKLLNSPCPIWKRKKIIETHTLLLIPATVNGNPLTLNRLERLVTNPKEGKAMKIDIFEDAIKRQYGNTPVIKSYWVLMTNDNFSRSLNESLWDKLRLIAERAEDPEVEYQFPKALEAVVLNFIIYVSARKRLYSCGQSTSTFCREQFNDGRPLVVGCSSVGLRVYLTRYGSCTVTLRRRL